MKKIPLNAKIECSDGSAGRLTYVVIDPVTPRVTHLVVQDRRIHWTERLVPVAWIEKTTSESIRLRCTRGELSGQQPFVVHSFSRRQRPRFDQGAYMVAPYIVPNETVMEEVELERVPRGELAVHRSACVLAVDGLVGEVDEFLVDANDGHITHLVLREGHLWNQKDVTVPVSDIDWVEKGAVHLRLDKNSVDLLSVR